MNVSLLLLSMPTHTKFTLEHKLQGDFEIVYSTLLDFKKFGEIHPYMTEVSIIKEQPEYIEYNIVEEIYLFGFIKNYPTYTARIMELKKDQHIRYTSPVKKNIFLTVDITFSHQANGSLLVTEAFEIQSSRLMGRMFGNILKKAHLKFFENLNKLLRTSVEDIRLN